MSERSCSKWLAVVIASSFKANTKLRKQFEGRATRPQQPGSRFANETTLAPRACAQLVLLAHFETRALLHSHYRRRPVQSNGRWQGWWCTRLASPPPTNQKPASACQLIQKGPSSRSDHTNRSAQTCLVFVLQILCESQKRRKLRGT